MHSSTEPVIQPEWVTPNNDEPPDPATRWLSLVQRFSFVRAHISIFAVGSVFFLVLNLLANPAHVQVDRWISAWAIIVVIHAIVAGMATLALELMADDDIRPASEVSWERISSWALRKPESDWPAPPPSPTAESESTPDPWHGPPSPPPDEERVSWRAASDAAWLAGNGQADSDRTDTGEHSATDTTTGPA